MKSCKVFLLYDTRDHYDLQYAAVATSAYLLSPHPRELELDIRNLYVVSGDRSCTKKLGALPCNIGNLSVTWITCRYKRNLEDSFPSLASVF